MISTLKLMNTICSQPADDLYCEHGRRGRWLTLDWGRSWMSVSTCPACQAKVAWRAAVAEYSIKDSLCGMEWAERKLREAGFSEEHSPTAEQIDDLLDKLLF